MRKLMMGVAAFALSVGFAAAQSASAATTPVNASGGGNGSERCFIGAGGGANCAAGGAYGGGASIQTVLEADPTVGTLTRVDDSIDQLWSLTGPQGLVLARARYAGFGNTFGYIPGASGGSYSQILGVIADNKSTYVTNAGNPYLGGDVKQYGAPNPEYEFVTFVAGSPFRFAIQRPAGEPAQVVSSQDSDNIDGLDHMVTLQASVTPANDTVTDASGNVYQVYSRYIVGFEDKYNCTVATCDFDESSDRDFNDYIFELVNVKPVPVPAAIPLFLSGLAAVGLIARRRKS